MATRIRYARLDNGDLKSLRALTAADNRNLFVSLSPSELKFSITDATTGELLSEGTAVSISRLKLKAKAAAKALGVVFETEGRRDRTVPTEA